MTLPFGTKSLAEIRGYPDPVDQVWHYSTLLECVLDGLDPSFRQSNSSATAKDLIEHHEALFEDFKGICAANWVRNELTHAGGSVTREQVQRAARAFDHAIVEVLPLCSAELRVAASGTFSAAGLFAALTNVIDPSTAAAAPPADPAAVFLEKAFAALLKQHTAPQSVSVPSPIPPPPARPDVLPAGATAWPRGRTLARSSGVWACLLELPFLTRFFHLRDRRQRVSRQVLLAAPSRPLSFLRSLRFL